MTFGNHTITVDIPTGNLRILADDAQYKFHLLPFGISRAYDVQEQHMQHLYGGTRVNVDPKPHWFGNWRLTYEAHIEEMWHGTRDEVQVDMPGPLAGMFNNEGNAFECHVRERGLLKGRLATYGIPQSLLTDLDWVAQDDDTLLRTTRADTLILTGRHFRQTLSDLPQADVWVISPVTGQGILVSSRYCYDRISTDGRERDSGLITVLFADGLGHVVRLEPAGNTPPYTEFHLSDSSGRTLRIFRDAKQTYLDGYNVPHSVTRRLVNEVADDTYAPARYLRYEYGPSCLLERVLWDSELGQTVTRYQYEHPDYRSILTRLEDTAGRGVSFDYVEDKSDADTRLEPRLKIREIVNDDGQRLVYEHDRRHGRVEVVVENNGVTESCYTYTYTTDLSNTRRRYVTGISTKVTSGFVLDSAGSVAPRTSSQLIVRQRVYSVDGRYNLIKEIDPLGREVRYEHNAWNQVKKTVNFDGIENRFTYDVTNNPSPEDPLRFDLLCVEREEVIRYLDPVDPSLPFVEANRTITKSYSYKRHTANTSSDPGDIGRQSTHRVESSTDELENVWQYTYDEIGSHSPISPTTIETPTGATSGREYNQRGDLTAHIDAEGNRHEYSVNDQNQVFRYVDPNAKSAEVGYYAGSTLAKSFSDQLGETWALNRDLDGRLISVVDPMLDETVYDYFSNGRLKTIKRVRKPIPHPGDPSRSAITAYEMLTWQFEYSVFGQVSRFTNPAGLSTNYSYDEDGRLSNTFAHDPVNEKVRYAYDAAGQLQARVDKDGRLTTYRYYANGRLLEQAYPAWKDDTTIFPGTAIQYSRYDNGGNLLEVSESGVGVSYSYAYDQTGNLTVERHSDGFELSHRYDNDGRWFGADSADGVFSVSIALDNLGRPRSLTDSSAMDTACAFKYSYTQSVAGVTRVLRLFEREVLNAGLKSVFDYDDSGKLARVQHMHFKASDGNWVSRFDQEVRHLPDGLVHQILGDNPTSVLYDSTKQLAHEIVEDLWMDYDRAGNRLWRTKLPRLATSSDNTYDPLNKLTEEKLLGLVASYEGEGNTKLDTATGTVFLAFDAQRRLRRWRDQKIELRYSYDYRGRLVGRELYDVTTGDLIEQDVLRFLGRKPIIIKRDGALFALLTWDPDGSLLRVRRVDWATGGSFSHSAFGAEDALRSLSVLHDVDWLEVARRHFDAWGSLRTATDTSDAFRYLGFRGGIADSTTGLVLFGARWYWPAVGRWISEDDADLRAAGQFQDAQNRYAYVSNNPLNLSDPEGRDGTRERQGVVIVLISRSDYWFGNWSDHVAVWVENGDNPLLLDVAGGFRAATRGSTAVLTERDALSGWLKYQNKIGQVEAFPFNVTLEEEKELVQRLMTYGNDPRGWECANESSRLLKGIGIFRNLEQTNLPPLLHYRLSELQKQQEGEK